LIAPCHRTDFESRRMFGSTRKEFEQHAPDEALVREVGVHLRQARLARGEELADVAEFLRIRPDYLQGLEQGDLSAMPGRTYALGFLRSYAQYLGFDGDDLIAQIRSSVAGLTGQAHLHDRTPLSESRLPKVPIVVVSLAALAGVYAGWAYFDDRSRAEDELVVEVPDDLRQEAPPLAVRAPATVPGPPPATAMPAEITPAIAPRIEPEAAAAAPSDPSALPPDAASGTAAMPEADDAGVLPPAAGQPAPSVIEAPEPGAGAQADPHPPAAAIAEPAGAAPVAAVGPERPVPDQTTAGAATHPAAEVLAALAPVAGSAAAPTVYRTDAAAGRVILRARSSAWVHVSSTSNDYLWVKTLRPGDAFVVPDRPDLVLWTGNAGGIEVIVDGTPLPPLGPEARVVRNVSLQPGDLLRRLPPAPAADATAEPPSLRR
jgi:cytoskeleton protein RodZ